MLTNYTVCGYVHINGEQIVSTYQIHNLTNSFVSEELISEKGYYSLNLCNYPEEIFNHGDIVVIKFKIRDNGIWYYDNVYTILDSKDNVKTININLVPNWRYTSEILLDINNNDVIVKFFTTYYSKILFKLYYKFNGIYKEIDSALITKQIVNLHFDHHGNYKIAGYVLDTNRLLSYCEKEITIGTIVESVKDYNQIRYIEWE